MKRKILCLALAGVTLFSVCACTMPDGSSDSSGSGEAYPFESVFSDADKVMPSSYPEKIRLEISSATLPASQGTVQTPPPAPETQKRTVPFRLKYK